MKHAVGGGAYVREDLDVGGATGASIGEDVEVAEQRLVVRGDSHDATAFSSTTDVLGTIIGFGEVKVQFVSAGLQRNGVSEFALTAIAIDAGIERAPNMLRGAANGGAA